MPLCLRGLELSRRFYFEAVRPVLEQHHPELSYAAALIGPGSEVQGWDDDESTDHHWGPRLQLFVEEHERAVAPGLEELLKLHLPHRFAGLSTNFGEPDEFGVRLPITKDTGPVEHMIKCETLGAFLKERGAPSELDHLSDEQWLGFSSQVLRELTGGDVFHDATGAVASMRQRLAWYPLHIWYELMARVWDELDEEEAFVGRTGTVGDDIGSRLLAARQANRLIRLTLLMERQYAPYSKWLGTAFSSLPISKTLGLLLDKALRSDSWQERQTGLAEAYEMVAGQHNSHRFTEPQNPQTHPFYSRPYTVLGAARFAKALRAAAKS